MTSDWIRQGEGPLASRSDGNSSLSSVWVQDAWQINHDWKTFIGMLPMYAEKCFGEGDMHDTAMLLGALGWDRYAAPVEIITPYFGSSGTGQINAIFPVTPLPAAPAGAPP